MDVLSTSLDALLQRASNPQNQNIDVAAVEAFSALINKEKEGPSLGVKLIASRIHSPCEKEVLQTLHVLDTCMVRCGTAFHSEIGKFRFLNEMIKLVSPKYLASQTPPSVRQKVLQLLYVWTLDYPKETKIREAYEMLRKQGVIKETPTLSVSADGINVAKKSTSSVFQDEEKSKLLQYLLQSKNPEDLQAANRLIKSMVKEDDKRAELKSKRTSELESIHNNIRLLNEMLDSYKPGTSSEDELDLIKELHQSCERLKISIFKLAAETPQNEEMLNEILQASDDLNHVSEKYKTVIVDEGPIVNQTTNDSLLDLDGIDLRVNNNSDLLTAAAENKEIDVLCDVFSAASIPEQLTTDFLLPLVPESRTEKANSGKSKALEELDVLSEHLLKENLQSSKKLDQQFNKVSSKIPMNMLVKQPIETKIHSILDLDLNCLLEKPLMVVEKKMDESKQDDVLVNIAEETTTANKEEEKSVITQPKRNEIKPKKELKISDIFVELDQIRPSSIPPLTVLDEKNGITVTLHFAKDKPREDVNVIVVTSVSKNELPLNSYLFQAVVPKGCKLKLQPPSKTDLPPFNPFLPPAAITQIMLISNPEAVDVSLKFIVSYVMDDETYTEMGDVAKLPWH